MEQVIKDYHKFNAFGIEEDLVSASDKKQLDKLYKIQDILYKQIPTLPVLRAYPAINQLHVFQYFLENNRITFYNSSDKAVEVLAVFKRNAKVLLKCVFCKTRVGFSMWLDTFLSEFEAGNIKKVKPDQLANFYLGSCENALAIIQSRITNLKNKYNDIYNERASEVKQGYQEETKKYEKIKSTGKRKELSTEEAIERAKKVKGLDKIKDYWNTKITEAEKTQLLDWICKNIYSIRVYGLAGGQSGNILNNQYVIPSLAGNFKIRDVKFDDDGNVISQDSIVAHMSFVTTDGAPLDILEKVTSPKRNKKSIFYNNRLNDTNLALFLLDSYIDHGFKAGVRNLYKYISK